MRRLLLPAALAALLAAAPAAAPAAAEGKPGETPSVRVRPVGIPVVKDGRVTGYAFVEVTLEVTDALKAAAAQQAGARLHDAVLRVVYDAVAAGWIERGNVVRGAELRQRIDEASEALPQLGAGAVTRVLITPARISSSWP